MSSRVITKEEPLRIAIVGGGIAGLTLAVPLARAQKDGAPIQVHVYEAATAFTEIGAGIGFGPNAQRILKKLNISEYLDNLVKTAKVPDEKRNKLFDLRRSEPDLPKDQSLVAEMMGENAGIGAVLRSDFLDSLVNMYPKEQASFQKRLESYTDSPGSPLQLKFTDGTTAEADVLIGCDGVKSRTRRCMFADDSSSPSTEGKATRAKFSGWIAYRAVVPGELLREPLGELFMSSTLWMGTDRHILHLPMRGGALINVVMVVYDREGKRAIGHDGPWSEAVSHELLLEDFKDFNETCKAIVKAAKTPTAWGVFDIPELPWFSDGRVALSGDAAHASTMHQGAGAGQGLEDSFILTSLLTNPSVLSAPREKIVLALKAYSHVRRPRATRFQRTSAEAGMLYEYALPGVMRDGERIRENMLHRMEWIWGWDEDQAVQDALDFWTSAAQASGGK